MHERNEDAMKTPKDEQRTPPSLFRKLDAMFHFTLDAAASHTNHLCPFYFTKELDALKQSWKGNVYCNPPYSPGSILPFVKKSLNESDDNGAIVVMLLPADTSTEYFDICFDCAYEIYFIKRRVIFNHEDGTPIKGSPKFGSIIPVFDSEAKDRTTWKTNFSRMSWR